MRYAVSLPPFGDPHDTLRMAALAEAAGWDAVLLWDHLRWIVALGLDVHDPWSLLAAIAVRTERIRLGTCVTPLSRRRPQIVAKHLVTLDHLSGGRAVLGVGLGEPPDADFSDYGDIADAGVRAARLDEGLAVLDGLVRGARVDHDGVHLQVHAEHHPPAVQLPRPPIFVAGTLPLRGPLGRALHWDGYYPIGAREVVTPRALDAALAGVARPDGWDLYASINPPHATSEWAAVGVTWLVQGAWPVGDWVDGLTRAIAAGPPR